MIDKLQLLYSRRSIRAFVEGEVTKDQIQELLEAAMCAPTAANRKPWHFTVVEDADLRQKFADMGKRACAAVPVVILVSGDKRRFFDGDRIEVQPYWQQDCAAATQNILLAANGMGLGSLWMGVFPSKEAVAKVSEIIGAPEHVVPFALVAIGHKGEEKETRTQFEAEQVDWK
ncbi:MAG: nitroreductase family protein [Symbiobacteriaceae bacterium]|nr:nitroreductase family protein [Symbiobacteriaceae bacterium]